MKKNQTGKPVITDSFAAQEICPGDTWNVYLRASDPEGDMKTIFCSVSQAGRGSYPVSPLKVPDGRGGELSGYIFLNTGAGQASVFTPLTLRVEIQDRAGNLSRPVSFSLSFDPRAEQDSPPPGIFRDEEIGPLMVFLDSGANGP